MLSFFHLIIGIEGDAVVFEIEKARERERAVSRRARCTSVLIAQRIWGKEEEKNEEREKRKTDSSCLSLPILLFFTFFPLVMCVRCCYCCYYSSKEYRQQSTHDLHAVVVIILSRKNVKEKQKNYEEYI